MKVKMLLSTLALGTLLFTGCASSNNGISTPSSNTIDKSVPKNVAVSFSALYNTGKYILANTLMCDNSLKSPLFKKLETIYFTTISNDISTPNEVKSFMKRDKTGEYDYLKKIPTYALLEGEQKKHFLLNYSKMYVNFKYGDYLRHFNYVRDTQEEIDENTVKFNIDFLKTNRLKSQQVLVTKTSRTWCVNNFQ